MITRSTAESNRTTSRIQTRPAPALLLQRKCACGDKKPGVASGECGQCRDSKLGVQRRRAAEHDEPATVPEVVHDVLRSTGQPLDAATRSLMEPRFGHDFSRVRVHTDARAAESAQAVNALAYTVGRDITFAAGQYNPNTTTGRQLLAHELTHVVQQAGASSTAAGGALRLGAAHDASEQEAEESSARAAHGESVAASQHSAALKIQRLPPPFEDPIHQPIIDRYRREHGFPLEEDAPGMPPVGPSDAEIKYALNLPPPESDVFYVSFQNAVPPNAPDHTQASPGPAGNIANRAGYARVRLQKRMSIKWDVGPPAADGRVPVYAQSVNVFYRLDPLEVYVSSNYAVGSCPYTVTLEHERSHIEAFTRIFHEGRETLVRDLNTVQVPTRNLPTLVAPADVTAFQDGVGARLSAVIVAHSRGVVTQMETDRNTKDSAAAYALVYARCPANQW
ncbi:MAG: DUF4157 domain-containing protein [Pyrinomonadaceae bacterium]|nr:DUF4157 domain-containing protein [Pyrinomonadaceae bacterium]